MAKKEEEQPEQGITTQAPETPSSQKVVSNEEWDKITTALASVESMAGLISTQKAQIELLTAAADKRKLVDIQEKLKTPGNSIVKLRTLRNDEGALKIVTAWVMKTNETFIDPLNKREVANQTTEMVLEDDSRVLLSFVDFDRRTREQMLLSEVLKKDGDSYTVKVLGGEEKQYTIDVRFLN